MLATAGAVPGRPVSSPWWMFVLGAAFAGYYALLLHSDLTRPEPIGFAFEFRDGAMLLKALEPDSAAAHAGLAVGDRITTANHNPIHNRLDWLLIETNLQVGQPIHLGVARNSRVHGVDLLLARAPPRFWRTTAGGTLLIARGVQFVTLVLAFVVGFRRP